MKIEELMSSTLDKMATVIDINSVIGKPIESDGTIVIPISKVCFGFVAGAGEYSETEPKTMEELPYAGGSGGGVSIKPLGFLMIRNDKSEYVNVNKEGEIEKWKDLLTAGIKAIQK